MLSKEQYEAEWEARGRNDRRVMGPSRAIPTGSRLFHLLRAVELENETRYNMARVDNKLGSV